MHEPVSSEGRLHSTHAGILREDRDELPAVRIDFPKLTVPTDLYNTVWGNELFSQESSALTHPCHGMWVA